MMLLPGLGHPCVSRAAYLMIWASVNRGAFAISARTNGGHTPPSTRNVLWSASSRRYGVATSAGKRYLLPRQQTGRKQLERHGPSRAAERDLLL